jgi:predicted DNA-binding transcriptional regulator AlpA
VYRRHAPVGGGDELKETDMNGPKKLWTISELAAYLGVAKSWIYDRTAPARTEGVPHFKIGKYLRFDPESEEFQAWLRRAFKDPSQTN